MTSIFKRKGRRGVTLKYRDGAGKWKMLSFRKRGLAENKALELRKNPDTGRPVPILKEYAKTWLERRKPHLRPGPFMNYELAFRRHILPLFGTLALDQIERGPIRDLVAGKLNSGFSKSHVTLIRGALKLCLQEAVDEGLIYTNPAAFQLRAGPRRNTNVKALTQAQLVQVFEAARAKVPNAFVLFRLLAMTGMRLGEALGLKWEDIDWGARTVRVCRSWTRTRAELTKTGYERTVDLAGMIVDDLRSWETAAKARALEAGREKPEWVFPSARTGRPISSGTVSADFKAALKAAKLATHYTPHSLRHTYASLLLSAGESPYYVQRQLGHTTMTMTTGLYGRWLPAGNPEAVDRLAARLSPSLSLTTTEPASTTERT